MRLSLDCVPCVMRQALEASRMATQDESKQEEVLREVARLLSETSFDKTPPEIADRVHHMVREVTGTYDPYSQLKQEYNQKAMSMYPQMKEKVNNSQNRLLTAVKLAIAGNIIDFGPGHDFDLEESIDEVLEMDLTVDHFEKFEEALNNSQTIYYLCDNTGEIIMDRILVEEMRGKDITVVVKKGPIINDATIEDARYCKIDEIASIEEVSNGERGNGPERNSHQFITKLSEADMVVSKGQGNYEALSDAKANIFFMLRAKCSLVARDLGVPGIKVGDTVLMNKNFI
ncbi:MAG: damage-control phosphatase ARMT1 family protein [Halobacteriota archaeon]